MTEHDQSSTAINASSPMALLTGDHVEVVGVEADEEEPEVLRMYVGHRAKGIYALIADDQAKRDLERAWSDVMSRLLVPRPPADRLYQTDAGRRFCQVTDRAHENGRSEP